MPSSMIFVGLVVIWLLILVPAIARRRQEVARPSVAALGGRVLERSQRRDQDVGQVLAANRDVEVDVRHEREPARTESEGRRTPPPSRAEAGPPARGVDLDGWTWRQDEGEDDEVVAVPHPRTERAPDAPPRYRPGRGGYDPQAAALTARARYAVRQRVVLVLLVLAVGTAVVAAFTLPMLWWVHGAVDLTLVGYLVYLRRQVRVEEAIRHRRTARANRAPEPELDEPVERRPEVPASRRPLDDELPPAVEETAAAEADERAETGREPAARIPDPAPPVEEAPALPRLKPMPTPPVPVGTSLVEGGEDDPELHELDRLERPDYRRAAGQ